MGCDGGTIPRRDELVRTKKKPEQKDKNAETVAKWKHCAISQEPLRKPIVACELGKLYNKEAVIEHILNKEKASEVAGHISKLIDVKELNLTEKAGFQAKEHQKGDEYVDFNDSRYICPVTGLDMNGKQRFYLIWKCGCVISERAAKEVKSESCHKCGKPMDENDIIILNGTDEEIDVLREKMTERRRLAKLEKKKRKKNTPADSAEEKKIKLEPNEDSSSGSSCNEVINGKGIIHDSKPSTSGMANGKNTKLSNCDKTEPCLKNGAKHTKNVILPEKSQKAYSIAKDPTASAAYKSLFTTSKAAKSQGKAHWVTHNPLYF